MPKVIFDLFLYTVILKLQDVIMHHSRLIFSDVVTKQHPIFFSIKMHAFKNYFQII